MADKNVTPPKTEPTAFTRFEDFTRKLMAVPKKEIDAEEKKYQRAKAKRKKSNNRP